MYREYFSILCVSVNIFSSHARNGKKSLLAWAIFNYFFPLFLVKYIYFICSISTKETVSTRNSLCLIV
jgi:hypothetical protein